VEPVAATKRTVDSAAEAKDAATTAAAAVADIPAAKAAGWPVAAVHTTMGPTLWRRLKWVLPMEASRLRHRAVSCWNPDPESG
jgi:hypothetical protein